MEVSTSPPQARRWQFWVDRGGTFTDVIAVSGDGRISALKLLSEAPGQYEDAAIEGIGRLIASLGADDDTIDAVRIGTTIGTNALLERRGARTVLVTTAGLRDVLRIGTQQRPSLFSLDVQLPEVLYESVIEAQERVGADGTVVTALDESALRSSLEAARRAGIDSVAVAFLHGYKYPHHEQRAAALATAAGFDEVVASHEISARAKLVERGRTTVVDAYLSPKVRSYVAALEARLDTHGTGADLAFMQSNGGLIAAAGFRGHNSILSGPAGGVVGMANSAIRAGFPRAIGFDMGGTSTDVSLHAGEFERTGSTDVAGTSIAVPTMRIHTVAAGGGSILAFRDDRLQVGPASAGADPGPACYGKGGPATLTDANVYLGRIQADHFPRVFGADGHAPIDARLAAAAIEALAAELPAESRLPPDEVAAGCVRIAVNHMAAAIEKISIQRGHDPREFALSCFGGAGGQHACLVAEALGIDTVLVDPLAGVLSAYGIGIADLRRIEEAPIELDLDSDAIAAADAAVTQLISRLEAAADSDGRVGTHSETAPGAQQFESRLLCRAGTSDSLISIHHAPGSTAEEIATAFANAYRERFGFEPHTPDIFVDAVEVESVIRLRHPDRAAVAPATIAPAPVATRRAWVSGGWQETALYDRAMLGSGSRLDGPAIVVEANGTTVIDAGWTATVDASGTLLLRRRADGARRSGETDGSPRDLPADPVLLEIFNRQFVHVAEQMGAILEQTAESVNIRERLDYSCALFDHRGALIANAPHVPVHLGSMSESVRAVLTRFPTMERGDSFVMNAPYSGGTHLPDVTVVTPMFGDRSERPKFLVASRAHHADIGGLTPGSMPARSRTIEEEGVLLEPMAIVRAGRLLDAQIRACLTHGPYPARDPDRNIADLRAQLAANARGIRELEKLIRHHGMVRVDAYTQFVQENAAESVRNAVARLRDGDYEVELDGGERIRIAVRVDHEARTAVIDFTGTSGQSASNYNAPASIARAVVLYVFRTLIDHDIPLNDGCLAPLRIILPAGSLVDPQPPAAVVAGNVETSQCIADALLAALGALAASQGTMNNFTFGDAEYQYYETICGGCGAGPGFAGASAVHSHMTNSRLTDPEILEQRYPIRIRRFEIRAGSGGRGRWPGGDGIVREFEFLAALSGSILANRRRTEPFGLAGGSSGAPGRNYLIRSSGERIDYGAAAEIEFSPGDRFVIETPGGGGYGS